MFSDAKYLHMFKTKKESHDPLNFLSLIQRCITTAITLRLNISCFEDAKHLIIINGNFAFYQISDNVMRSSRRLNLVFLFLENNKYRRSSYNYVQTSFRCFEITQIVYTNVDFFLWKEKYTYIHSWITYVSNPCLFGIKYFEGLQ